MELDDAHAEIGNMDTTIKSTWEQLKEANLKKRSAQTALRVERSASQELVNHYSDMQKEFNSFKSNTAGYIKRSEYVESKNANAELQEKLIHANKMVEAWKGQCGRFQLTNKSNNKEMEQLNLLKVKLQEQIALMKTNA